MLPIILPLGFALSVIPWSALPTLAPGRNNTKVYYISPVGRDKQCGRGQGHGRLNRRGRLRAANTRFTIVRKILIVVGIVVTI
jgi:hypothetical protein